VAGVIGLIMLKIFESKNAQAEQCAVDLGLALQLTNILRDIKEDFARGRVYLPQDEMNQCQIDESDIAGGVVDKNFKDFMRFQIKRARDYFYKASQGIELIKDARCQFVTFLILELYAKILQKIEKNRYDVYHSRAIVPIAEKIFTLVYLSYRFSRRSFTFKM
jgi:phytoene synthase